MKLYITKKLVLYGFIHGLAVILLTYYITVLSEDLVLIEHMGFTTAILFLLILPTASIRLINNVISSFEIRAEHGKCISQIQNQEFANATITVDKIIAKYKDTLNYKYKMTLYHDASMAYMLLGDFYTSELRLKESMLYGVNLDSKVLQALLHYQLDGDLRYAVEVYQLLKQKSKNSPFIEFLEEIIFENT